MRAFKTPYLSDVTKRYGKSKCHSPVCGCCVVPCKLGRHQLSIGKASRSHSGTALLPASKELARVRLLHPRAPSALLCKASIEEDVFLAGAADGQEVGLLGVLGLTTPEAFPALAGEVMRQCRGQLKGMHRLDGPSLSALAIHIQQEVFFLLPAASFCQLHHKAPEWRQAGASAHALLKSFLDDSLCKILDQAQWAELQALADSTPESEAEAKAEAEAQPNSDQQCQIPEQNWARMSLQGCTTLFSNAAASPTSSTHAQSAPANMLTNTPTTPSPTHINPASLLALQQQLQEAERSCVEVLEQLLEGPELLPLVHVEVGTLLRNPLLKRLADEVMDEQVQAQLSQRPSAVPLAPGQQVPLVNGNLPAAPFSKGHTSHSVLLPLDSTLLQQLLAAEPSEELRQRVFEAGLESQASSVFSTLDAVSALHQHQALLESHPSYSHLALQGSCLGTPEAAMQFLHDLLCALRPLADAEVALYTAYQQGGGPLNGWNVKYLHRQAFEEARIIPDWHTCEPYFSLDSCLEGAGRLLSQVLGVSLQPVGMGPAESWSEGGVSKLQVWDEEAVRCLGEIYMEFDVEFAHGHAATTSLIRFGSDPSHLPAVALYFPLSLTPRWGTYLTRPAFLRSLLHELGHALHYLLSPTHPDFRASAVYCPTDLAEVPSHVLEKYVEEPGALRLMLRHAVTGEPMPGVMCQMLGQYYCVGCTALEMQEHALVGMLDLVMHGAGAVGGLAGNGGLGGENATPPGVEVADTVGSTGVYRSRVDFVAGSREHSLYAAIRQERGLIGEPASIYVASVDGCNSNKCTVDRTTREQDAIVGTSSSVCINSSRSSSGSSGGSGGSSSSGSSSISGTQAYPGTNPDCTSDAAGAHGTSASSSNQDSNNSRISSSCHNSSNPNSNSSNISSSSSNSNRRAQPTYPVPNPARIHSTEQLWRQLRHQYSSLPNICMTWPAYQCLRDKSSTHAGVLYAYDFSRYVAAAVWHKHLLNGGALRHGVLRELLWKTVLCRGAAVPAGVMAKDLLGIGARVEARNGRSEVRELLVEVDGRVVKHMVPFEAG